MANYTDQDIENLYNDISKGKIKIDQLTNEGLNAINRYRSKINTPSYAQGNKQASQYSNDINQRNSQLTSNQPNISKKDVSYNTDMQLQNESLKRSKVAQSPSSLRLNKKNQSNTSNQELPKPKPFVPFATGEAQRFILTEDLRKQQQINQLVNDSVYFGQPPKEANAGYIKPPSQQEIKSQADKVKTKYLAQDLQKQRQDLIEKTLREKRNDEAYTEQNKIIGSIAEFNKRIGQAATRALSGDPYPYLNLKFNEKYNQDRNRVMALRNQGAISEEEMEKQLADINAELEFDRLNVTGKYIDWANSRKPTISPAEQAQIIQDTYEGNFLADILGAGASFVGTGATGFAQGANTFAKSLQGAKGIVGKGANVVGNQLSKTPKFMQAGADEIIPGAIYGGSTPLLRGEDPTKNPGVFAKEAALGAGLSAVSSSGLYALGSGVSKSVNAAKNYKQKIDLELATIADDILTKYRFNVGQERYAQFGGAKKAADSANRYLNMKRYQNSILTDEQIQAIRRQNAEDVLSEIAIRQNEYINKQKDLNDAFSALPEFEQRRAIQSYLERTKNDPKISDFTAQKVRERTQRELNQTLGRLSELDRAFESLPTEVQMALRDYETQIKSRGESMDMRQRELNASLGDRAKRDQKQLMYEDLFKNIPTDEEMIARQRKQELDEFLANAIPMSNFSAENVRLRKQDDLDAVFSPLIQAEDLYQQKRLELQQAFDQLPQYEQEKVMQAYYERTKNQPRMSDFSAENVRSRKQEDLNATLGDMADKQSMYEELFANADSPFSNLPKASGKQVNTSQLPKKKEVNNEIVNEIKMIDEELNKIDDEFEKAVIDLANDLKREIERSDGTVIIPTVDAKGTVTWTNSTRGTTNPVWYQKYYDVINKSRWSNDDFLWVARNMMEKGQNEFFDRPFDEISGIKERRESLLQVRDYLEGEMNKEDVAMLSDEELIRKSEEFIQVRKPVFAANRERGKIYVSLNVAKRKLESGEVSPKEQKRLQTTIKRLEKELSEADQKLKELENQFGGVNDTNYFQDEYVQRLRIKRNSKSNNDVQGFQMSDSNELNYRIPMPEPKGKSVEPISIQEVLDTIRNDLGVTIRKGRMKTRKSVLGFFRVKPEVIRSRVHGDIQVISHEVGHALDKRYDFENAGFDQELLNFIQKVSPNHLKAYDESQYIPEAIAEYFRQYFVDRGVAESLAPRFTAYLKSRLTEKELSGLNNVTNAIERWNEQGAYEQLRGRINREGREFDQSMRSKAEKVYENFVDKNYPLAKFEMLTRKVTEKGKSSLFDFLRRKPNTLLDAEDSPYKLASLYEGTPEKIRLFIENNLNPIFTKLDQFGYKVEELIDFATALHARDLQNKGIESGFTPEQINATIKRLGTPNMLTAHKMLMQYNQNLRDMMYQGGLIDQSTYVTLRNKYPNYIPFQRFFDEDLLESPRGVSQSFVDVSAPIKKIKGSDRPIIDPLESMIVNASKVIDAVDRNKVGQALWRLANNDGAGAFIERLGDGSAVSRENIATVWIDGKKQQLQFNSPELYQAYKNLNLKSSGLVEDILTIPAQIIRNAITATPSFWLRSMLLDEFHAYMVTNEKLYIPYVDLFRGFFTMFKRPDLYEKWVNEGGAYGTFFSQDRKYVQAILESLKTDKKGLQKAIQYIRITPQLLQEILQFVPNKIEEARRLAIFKDLVEKKKKSPKEAAYLTRDLIDFQKRGAKMNGLSRTTPFLNPNIQGKDKVVRSFLNSPAKFVTRGLVGLSIPTMAIYLHNKNNANEEQQLKIKEAPEWMQNTNFLIAIPGTNDVARIPKPFDVSWAFANTTEQVMKYIDQNDPQTIGQFAKTNFVDDTIPSLLSPITPIYEVAANYNFHSDAPIVNETLMNREKKDQYDVYTAKLARYIGENFNLSPKKVEYIMSSYGGDYSRYANSLFDYTVGNSIYANDPKQPESDLFLKPITNRWIVSESYQPKSVSKFYDDFEKMKKKVNSAKFNQESADMNQYKRMQRFYYRMQDIQKRRRDVENNKQLSPQEKRSEVEKIRSLLIETARLANQKQEGSQ